MQRLLAGRTLRIDHHRMPQMLDRQPSQPFDGLHGLCTLLRNLPDIGKFAGKTVPFRSLVLTSPRMLRAHTDQPPIASYFKRDVFLGYV